jgi:hypothetical protein
MEHKSLLTEITEYCEAAGIQPSTLGVRVLGNSRFLDRLTRKLGKIEEDEQKLRAFMAANPPQRSQVSQ